VSSDLIRPIIGNFDKDRLVNTSPFGRLVASLRHLTTKRTGASRRRPRLAVENLETRLVPYTASFTSATHVIDPEDGTQLGIPGSVQVGIQLDTAAPEGGLAVYVSTEDISATAVTDYAQLDYEEVVIPEGQTSALLTVFAAIDSAVETDETFLLRLYGSDPQGGSGGGGGLPGHKAVPLPKSRAA
jgi:hypothetical protein